MRARVVGRLAGLVALVAGATTALGVGAAHGVPPTKVDIVGPSGSSQFGEVIDALPNGNFVVTDRFFDVPGQDDVGAIRLYDGDTLTVISTLTGSTTGDRVGNVTVLTNGDFVVSSPDWDNGAAIDAGAVTWVDGDIGLNGTVSAANSLVGSTTGDAVGSVRVLTNGNYVVVSDGWDNGPTVNVGAVTWGNGNGGTVGAVTTTNSLHGSTVNDRVGSNGLLALTNGNYVVGSASWNDGATQDVGAATWGNGAGGTVGAVTTTNSLHGSTAGDEVASDMVTLANGNYAVMSPAWDDGGTADVGAVTWGNGAGGTVGAVTTSNSLHGSTAGDAIGNRVTALSDGDYVVGSSTWDDGGDANVGAVRWANGNGGTVGALTTANSLYGPTAGDEVGTEIYALTNGNYVVVSPNWDDGGTANVGAATWGNGDGSTTGAVSVANSVIGSTLNDRVGSNGLTPLTNGNYVVASPNWTNAGAANAGAATWGNGAGGTVGAVSSANSLVGSTAGDRVGAPYALTNGNYVVASPEWTDGTADHGAATWGSGATGITGPVSTSNSLYGTASGMFVGNGGVTPLTDGNFVVGSVVWDDGATDVGAATWGNGATGTTGAVTTANSLHGSVASNLVGAPITPLPAGAYVVFSPDWDTDGTSDSGAMTWALAGGTTVGPITATNSVLGTAPGGGGNLALAYDPVHSMVLVGRPNDNTITVMYQAASVRVDKIAQGAETWSFDLSISPVPPGQPATKTVTQNTASVTWTNLIPGVVYTVSETSVPGWTSGAVLCTAPQDQTADNVFTARPDASVVCTVENVADLPETGHDPRLALTVGVLLAALGAALVLTRRRLA